MVARREMYRFCKWRYCMPDQHLRHGSKELDSSYSTERSSPVMLSVAKHLSAERDRPFAALRVTRCDCSNCHRKVLPCHVERSDYSPCRAPHTILYVQCAPI